MFPELEPLRAGEEFFAAHGRAAVAGDDATFVDRDPDGPERPDLPAAGWPVFGQWVAHELTADRSRLASRADVGELVNARTPRLNLESLYGLGPADQPYLVRRDDPARLLVGGTAERPDLPRNARASP
jgi:hypothetical protein